MAILLIAAGGCTTTARQVSRAERPGWSRHAMTNILRATNDTVCGRCDRCRSGAGPLSEAMRELQDTTR